MGYREQGMYLGCARRMLLPTFQLVIWLAQLSHQARPRRYPETPLEEASLMVALAY